MYRNNEQFIPPMPGVSRNPKGGYTYPKQMMTAQSTPERKVTVKETQPTSPVMANPAYLQGYLIDQIGKYMRVNFLIGTGTFIDKDGILEDVGIDHIVLRDIKTNDKVIADLYSIKFVEIPED